MLSSASLCNVPEDRKHYRQEKSTQAAAKGLYKELCWRSIERSPGFKWWLCCVFLFPELATLDMTYSPFGFQSFHCISFILSSLWSASDASEQEPYNLFPHRADTKAIGFFSSKFNPPCLHFLLEGGIPETTSTQVHCSHIRRTVLAV